MMIALKIDISAVSHEYQGLQRWLGTNRAFGQKTPISTALGGRVALLEDMVVLLEQRGLGIGSALLNAAISTARDSGCLRITLLTDSDNEIARGFYEKHGFVRSPMLAFKKLLI